MNSEKFTSPKPRRVLSLKVKRQVIELSKQGYSHQYIADQINVGRSTVTKILINKESITSATDGVYDESRKRIRKGTFEKLEEKLLKWCIGGPDYQPKSTKNSQGSKQINSTSSPIPVMRGITKQDIIQHAHMLANELELNSFTGSKSWYFRFKKRFNVKVEKQKGSCEKSSSIKHTDTLVVSEPVLNSSLSLEMSSEFYNVSHYGTGPNADFNNSKVSSIPENTSFADFTPRIEFNQSYSHSLPNPSTNSFDISQLLSMSSAIHHLPTYFPIYTSSTENPVCPSIPLHSINSYNYAFNQYGQMTSVPSHLSFFNACEANEINLIPQPIQDSSYLASWDADMYHQYSMSSDRNPNQHFFINPSLNNFVYNQPVMGATSVSNTGSSPDYTIFERSI